MKAFVGFILIAITLITLSACVGYGFTIGANMANMVKC